MYLGRMLAELVVVGLLLMGPVLTLVALIDLARRPASAWRAIGETQVLWTVVVLAAVIVGPAFYLAVLRPRLDQANTLDGSHAGF